jgi:drug/metabolite transporter (DMT)-like permease
VRARLAWALLFLTPALWSANMLVARWSSDWFPPHALAFCRWLVALVPMAAICGAELWRSRAEVRREWRDLAVLGALGMWVCGAFVYIAADTTSATNIGLIYAGVPVLVMLASAALPGERLGALQVLGAAAALAGVLAILSRGDVRTLLEVRFAVGDLWALTAAASWAAYSVLMRARPSRLQPFVRVTAVTLAGLAVLAPFTLVEIVLHGAPPLEWRSLAAVLIVGLLPGFGAYQAWSWLLREIGAARTGVVLYLTPVYTALLAALLLGEVLHGYHLAGACLVLGGVWLANRRVRRP